MATHDSNPGTSSLLAGSQDDSLLCPICLDIFQSPKILPGCFHTFCEACLINITYRFPSNFNCPTCREVIQVPVGGVSTFKTNFYIKSEDLEKARKGLFCSIHVKLELELYCVQCGCCICFKCKYTDHAEHKTEALGSAAEKVKAQLSKHKRRLDNAVLYTQKRSIDEVLEDQQELHAKKLAVRQNIQSRHAALVAITDLFRDEALALVEIETDSINSKLSQDLLSARQSLGKLQELQTRVQNAVGATVSPDVFAIAQEMEEGVGKQEVVENLIPNPQTSISRPILQSNGTMRKAAEAMREFMGSVVQMVMEVTRPEVSVKEQFRCDLKPCSEVYSLCPVQEGCLWICFQPSDPISDDACTNLYNADGRFQRSLDNVTDLITFKRTSSVPRGIFKKQDKSFFTTYTKSSSLLKLVYDKKKDVGMVQKSTVLCATPLRMKASVEFIINCGKQHSCDSDTSENLFVVVVKAQPPLMQNKVQLFQKPAADAIDTYTPPTEVFQPSDVCFYMLGGQEVLLVADKLNDAIHVVNVQNGRLEFLRYLASGCPLLLRPTALNTDIQGRLWVGCMGGSILVCEPV